jgi:hypothetical protein
MLQCQLHSGGYQGIGTPDPVVVFGQGTVQEDAQVTEILAFDEGSINFHEDY